MQQQTPQQLQQPPQQERASSARERFLASMHIDYEKWHDGVGYDLAVLRELTEAERGEVERMLKARSPRDWRDVEALAALAELGSGGARAGIDEALSDRSRQVRMAALPASGGADDQQRTAVLVEALETSRFYEGLTQALDLAAWFHPEPVIDALLRGALAREGEVAVHFAALLSYVCGKAKEPFDWEQRPFFLRFHTPDRREREAVFVELCRAIAVDERKYLGASPRPDG